MSVITEWEAYGAQRARWPAEGRHVLAHHDDESLVVYQAPNGEKVARRAIQIGLRGETLEAFATHEALVVDDMTPRVIAARDAGAKDWDEVELPLERVYRPSAAIAERLRLD
ncbi:MAG: hypothetical protein JJ863_14035 [Deltaproteobacteria bacterium]|nr:hypothetical protein [Deltaproteobacteria bacterium]